MTRPGVPLPESLAIVYFDDDCGFCRAWTNRAKARNSRQNLSFLPSIHPGFAALGLDAGIDSVVLVEGDRTLIRSQAVLAIVSKLDRPWRWLSVFRHLPRALCDAGYDAVARHRHRLGAGCQIPPYGKPPIR